MPTLSLKKNGRVICPEQGLTSQQYAAVQTMPGQYYSEKERQFTFRPTPMSLARLTSVGLVIPPEDSLSRMLTQWEFFNNSDASSLTDFSKLIKTNPWKHQPAAINFLQKYAAYMDMGMGTGKSLCTIASLAANEHKRTLILSPKAVVDVWPREFGKHAHEDQFEVLPLGDDYSSTAKKVDAARKHLARGGSSVVVVNYDSARRDDFDSWASTVKWDCVVGDELHRCKGHNSSTSKFVRNLPKGQGIGLSGTMLPHSPLDAWGQFAFLEPAIFGTSYMLFEKEYAVTGHFGEVLRYKNLDQLHEKIKPYVFSVSSDVLDLPPATHQQYRFRLSDKIMRAYAKFRKELYAQVENGVVTADNVLVRGLRLQQLTSGFYFDDNTGQEVDLGDRPKLDALADWVEDLPRQEKFVVFCRFKRDVRQVSSVLDKFGLAVGHVTGERNDLVKGQATFDPRFDCYVVNISSGGVGVDLTLANHAFYYSVSWNAGDYEQSLARLRRPGQTKHCHFAHAVCEGTIDEEIYEAFQERKDLANVVIRGIYEYQLKGGR